MPQNNNKFFTKITNYISRAYLTLEQLELKKKIHNYNLIRIYRKNKIKWVYNKFKPISVKIKYRLTQFVIWWTYSFNVIIKKCIKCNNKIKPNIDKVFHEFICPKCEKEYYADLKNYLEEVKK